jgi:hypothetical protein
MLQSSGSDNLQSSGSDNYRWSHMPSGLRFARSERIKEEKVLTYGHIHNTILSCMRRQELERHLQNLTEQFVDRFEIAEIHTGDLQVELTLKPHTPITERFIARLETALHQKIGSLSFFRVRRNVFMIRFTLQRSNDDSAADRVEEFPTPYASVGYKLGCIAHANEIRRHPSPFPLFPPVRRERAS